MQIQIQNTNTITKIQNTIDKQKKKNNIIVHNKKKITEFTHRLINL